VVTGNVRASGDVVAYATSDLRLKQNVLPIDNALEKLQKITGVMFDWKEGHELDRQRDTGLIAQEVEAVLPEVVVTRDNGYKAVRYDKIVGLLVEAIKEQQKLIEFLLNK
jgi:hypothetical protein